MKIGCVSNTLLSANGKIPKWLKGFAWKANRSELNLAHEFESHFYRLYSGSLTDKTVPKRTDSLEERRVLT